MVTSLTNGLALLAKQRKVEVIHGEAKFAGPHSLDVQGAERRAARRFQAMHHRGGLGVGAAARISR